MNCTPSVLLEGAECIECSLTHKQILASLVYVLCVSNSMNCTPSTLLAGANQLLALTEKQLLASAVYVLCVGGGGGGGGSVQVLNFTGASPTADGLVPANPLLDAIAYKYGGALPVYYWNTNTQAWE